MLAPQRGLTAIAKSKPKTEKPTNGRRCFKGVDPPLESDSKLVTIDEEADHQIVHRRRFGKAPISPTTLPTQTSHVDAFSCGQDTPGDCAVAY